MKVKPVKYQIHWEVKVKVWNRVKGQVHWELWNLVWNRFGNQLIGQVWIQVKNQVKFVGMRGVLDGRAHDLFG